MSELTTEERVRLQVVLGLGADGALLTFAPGALPLDANPRLGDVFGARICRIGHHDVVPRAHDWEHILAMLAPGEELLLLVDCHGRQGHRPDEARVPEFTLTLLLRGASARLSPIQRWDRFRSMIGQFRRQAFPESQVEELGSEELRSLLGATLDLVEPEVRCVVGLPGPRVGDPVDGAARPADARAWQSLNDVVEPFIDLQRNFRLVFAVGRLSESEVSSEFSRVTALRDALEPLKAAQQQESLSLGKVWSTTKGVTDTTGTTDTAGESRSAGVTGGFMLPIGIGVGASVSKSWSTSQSVNHSTTVNTQETGGGSATATGAVTRAHIRSDISLAVEQLDRRSRSILRSHGTGAYRGAVFVHADGADADLVARSIQGVLAGGQSEDHPLTSFAVAGLLPEGLLSATPFFPLVADAAPLLTLQQACGLLLLPEAELPGLQLRRGVFLGRNATPPIVSALPGAAATRRVSLGRDAFLVRSDPRSSACVELPFDDLFRHVLIAGTTGSGKTRRVLEMLRGVEGEDLRVVVFETAKRTYRERYSRAGFEPIVYTVGDSRSVPGSRARPLRFNPFYFDAGTSLKRHIAVLAEALTELLPTEAMIGPRLREAVEQCYVSTGWDIERGTCGRTPPRHPDTVDFAAATRDVIARLNYGPEVNANYRGALESRADVFLGPAYRDIFAAGEDQALDALFPPGCDVILEHEALPPGELNLPAFLLALLLDRIRASRSPSAPDRWLLVIEEAHNVLAREHEGRRAADESNAGRSLIRSFVRLLQEGRELRVGVIVSDQSPAQLARAVIANTNTKVVLRMEDGEEAAELGRIMALPEPEWRDLCRLDVGEALVKAPYMEQPVKSAPFLEDDDPHASPIPSGGAAPSYQTLHAAWEFVLDGYGPGPTWDTEILAAGTALHAAWAGRSAILARGDLTAHRTEFDALADASDIQSIRLVAERMAKRARTLALGPLALSVFTLVHRLHPSVPVCRAEVLEEASQMLDAGIPVEGGWYRRCVRLVRSTARREDFVGNEEGLTPLTVLCEALARASIHPCVALAKASPFDALALLLACEDSMRPFRQGAPQTPRPMHDEVLRLALYLCRADSIRQATLRAIGAP
jgi:hypothetical protein